MSLGTVVEVLGQQEGFELWRNTRVIFCWLDFMEVGFYFGIGTFSWWGLTSSLANIPALSQQDASVGEQCPERHPNLTDTQLKESKTHPIRDLSS